MVVAIPDRHAVAVAREVQAYEQGDVETQYGLGLMYRKGKGVLQNDTTAVKWWKLAAEQGSAKAQHNLAFMYRNGEGVLQNDIYAYMWFNIAVSQGFKIAGGERELVAKSMTPSQIEKAQELASECVKKKFKECD